MSSTYSGAILAESSLVAYYRCDDAGATLVDQLGAYNATFAGTVTKGASGATSDGNAAVAFGSDGYARTSSSPAFGSAFSVEFWVQRNGAANNTIAFYAGTPANWASTNTFLVYVGALNLNTAASVFENGTIPGGAGTSSQVADNLWHHLAIVLAASNFTIYLDGMQIGSPFASSGTITATEMDIGAGNAAGSVTQNFGGSLDEVAVYNAALSARQVWAHYRAAFSMPYNPLGWI